MKRKSPRPLHRISRSSNFHKPSSSILSKPRIVNLRPSECMSRTESLCATFFFFFWVAILSAPVASSNGKERSPSAYEVLQSYGFPVGLLPKGITGYELDKATGEFTASLNGTCSFTLENSYQLKYERTIEGVIEREMLRGLKGVSVKVTVVWLSIVEVVRQGGKLEFSIGVASAGFPVENFAECPRCGCGLACDATASSGLPLLLLCRLRRCVRGLSLEANDGCTCRR
ncbi:uncharacterized protein LOC130138974 [Syzygium oleosum]|uniref:uncharacterized protein LOC130138974 n=1 Tax=Syzygium oleosum TaxID=219896 RepID=UPI0024BA72EF|nr:uncharacterized protein LOC130138974 [Syzygium oleosum]